MKTARFPAKSANRDAHTEPRRLTLRHANYRQLYHPVSSGKNPILLEHVDYQVQEGRIFHMHYAIETGVLVSGRIKRLYRSFEEDCCPGDIWFSGVCEPHGYQVLEEPCRSVVFVTAPEALAALRFGDQPDFDAIAGHLAQPARRPRADMAMRTETIRIAEQALAVATAGNAFSHLWLKTLLLQLLLVAYSNWTPDSDNWQPTDEEYSVANRAVALVFASNEYLTVESVCSQVAMSRTAFSRTFKRVMGIGFAQFALRCRLGMVAEALTTTDQPIKELTYQYGFSDESHLCRAFANHYGVTPNSYREAHIAHAEIG